MVEQAPIFARRRREYGAKPLFPFVRLGEASSSSSSLSSPEASTSKLPLPVSADPTSSSALPPSSSQHASPSAASSVPSTSLLSRFPSLQKPFQRDVATGVIVNTAVCTTVGASLSAVTAIIVGDPLIPSPMAQARFGGKNAFCVAAPFFALRDYVVNPVASDLNPNFVNPSSAYASNLGPTLITATIVGAVAGRYQTVPNPIVKTSFSLAFAAGVIQLGVNQVDIWARDRRERKKEKEEMAKRRAIAGSTQGDGKGLEEWTNFTHERPLFTGDAPPPSQPSSSGSSNPTSSPSPSSNSPSSPPPATATPTHPSRSRGETAYSLLETVANAGIIPFLGRMHPSKIRRNIELRIEELEDELEEIGMEERVVREVEGRTTGEQKQRVTEGGGGASDQSVGRGMGMGMEKRTVV